MIRFPFSLVRDYVPSQIEARGGYCVIKQLSGKAYRDALAEKVFDEARRLWLRSNTEQARIERLAELLDTVDAYRVAHCIREQDVKLARERRSYRSGAFTRGLKLLFALGK